MNQELYSYDKYKGYEIFINNPYEAGGDDNYEGFVYFNMDALEGYCLGKTGEECLSKCKAWVDGLGEEVV